MDEQLLTQTKSAIEDRRQDQEALALPSNPLQEATKTSLGLLRG